MDILKEIEPARALARGFKKESGLIVGAVPTMGCLHKGHASLIKRSVEECDRTVVSVFVNPTQFGPGEDLASYPRDLGRDLDLCRTLGVSAVFCPEPSVMYPEGFATKVEVPLLSEGLCGRFRPNHFAGVCAVVLKLFHIIEPHRAYFGLKDAQQFLILSRLVLDLNLDVSLVPCPIVREPDGLALSSRNSYLSPREREAATVLSRALVQARMMLDLGERSAERVLSKIETVVASEPLATLDYAEAVDTRDLRPVERIEGETLIALAVRLGRTRLIDNIFYHPR
ncbi:MAG: pantoate--beta-alanine ligase [Deltaproteobacteria bacterium]|jgi:pantoate--beta-alanine ligase|nr:pantoate--beta-alanine ligase [Deltaproteobacteria bacterium]